MIAELFGVSPEDTIEWLEVAKANRSGFFTCGRRAIFLTQSTTRQETVWELALRITAFVTVMWAIIELVAYAILALDLRSVKAARLLLEENEKKITEQLVEENKQLELKIKQLEKISVLVMVYIRETDAELLQVFNTYYNSHSQYIARISLSPPILTGENKLADQQRQLTQKMLEREHVCIEIRYFVKVIPELRYCMAKYFEKATPDQLWAIQTLFGKNITDEWWKPTPTGDADGKNHIVV